MHNVTPTLTVAICHTERVKKMQFWEIFQQDTESINEKWPRDLNNSPKMYNILDLKI